MALAPRKESTDRKAYIVTGPTSGIGRATALELAKYGTIILVGRNPKKLDETRAVIERTKGRAVPVVCDLSDPASVRHAAAEIGALRLPIAGLLNNAGIRETRPTKNVCGWDMSFATNHLGPFALTEALIPHLPDSANVVFVVSAVEDPERRPARLAGFRGGRYISAEASARGEWKPGGSTRPGFDSYATTKQAILAAALAFARETPRLRFNAVEPGVNPTTGLGGIGGFARILILLLVPLFKPFVKVLRTPKQAGRVITNIMIDTSGKTGVYYDETGHPMPGSALVHDPKFQDRVVAETRALLSTVPVRNNGDFVQLRKPFLKI
jgi:NAD(P)-dependent dehydrogenase (short-subunit alcohol dehydrogenase family)